MKTTATISDCGADSPRFVRRTTLGASEYRRNFHQVDRDVIAAVTSEEADRVTPLMSKIYLRLVNAPAQYWEREGVLRLEAELHNGAHVKAWDALCELLGVASATASKALRWMHEQGVIGYFAGKNGVGIRVFLNRAASSIGSRTAGKKILEFTRASSKGARASSNEAGFNDSYADSEVLEKDLNPRAPKNGAEKTKVVKKYSDPQLTSLPTVSQDASRSEGSPTRPTFHVEISVDEIVSRLSRELEPSLQAAAERAAAHEHERTRAWLESRGLPKAARVAQREAYNVLRKYGALDGRVAPSSAHAEVGRSTHVQAGPQSLSAEEVAELAQVCVAMLEVHGQPIGLTLSEMSAESGGFLLFVDAEKVREKVEELLAGGGGCRQSIPK